MILGHWVDSALWVQSGAPWWSLGSFGVVGFILECRRVHSRSFRCALGVIAFIRGRWVHSGAPSRSSGVFRFIRVRRGCRLVHSETLGSFWCTLGFVLLIRGRWVNSGAPWGLSGSFGCALGVVGFIRCHLDAPWGSSGAPWWTSGSLGVDGFIRVRTVGRRVQWGPFGSFGDALAVVGVIRGRWPVRRGCRRVHSGSLGSFVSVIQSRCIHSVAPWVSWGSFRCAQGVIGFIRCGWVNSCVPWRS